MKATTLLLFLGLLGLGGCATSSPARTSPPRAPASSQAAPARPAPASAAAGRPASSDRSEEGLASYYAQSLEGRSTASGEPYRGAHATCAHRRHAFGTKLRVTLLSTGRSVECRVNDRGPFVKNRIVDLSRSLAEELGIVRQGVGRVRIEPR